MSNPICGNHHEPMSWKEGGVSKAGKPYQGFWSCKVKNPDGSFCKFKPAQGAAGTKTEDRIIAETIAKGESKEKDMLITRTAIAKSLIERGEKFSLELAREANQWIDFCLGKSVGNLVTSKVDETPIDEIPF
jgi:hypothetical protein